MKRPNQLKKGEKPYFRIQQPDGSYTRLGGPNWDIAGTKGEPNKYIDNYDKIDWSGNGDSDRGQSDNG